MAIDISFPNHDKLVSTFIQSVCLPVVCESVCECGMRPFVRYRKIMRVLYLWYREWGPEWNWNLFFYNIDTFAFVFPCICWWFGGTARHRRRFGSFSSWEYRTFVITNPLLSKRGSSPMSFCTATGTEQTNLPRIHVYIYIYSCESVRGVRIRQSNRQTKMDFFFDACSVRFLPSFCTRSKNLHIVSYAIFLFRFLRVGSALLLMLLLLGCRLWLIGSMKEIKAIYFGCVHVCATLDSRLCIHCLFNHSTDNVFIFLFLGFFYHFVSLYRSFPLNVTARANRLMSIISREIKFGRCGMAIRRHLFTHIGDNSQIDCKIYFFSLDFSFLLQRNGYKSFSIRQNIRRKWWRCKWSHDDSSVCVNVLPHTVRHILGFVCARALDFPLFSVSSKFGLLEMRERFTRGEWTISI